MHLRFFLKVYEMHTKDVHESLIHYIYCFLKPYVNREKKKHPKIHPQAPPPTFDFTQRALACGSSRVNSRRREMLPSGNCSARATPLEQGTRESGNQTEGKTKQSCENSQKICLVIRVTVPRNDMHAAHAIDSFSNCLLQHQSPTGCKQGHK